MSFNMEFHEKRSFQNFLDFSTVQGIVDCIDNSEET